MGSDLGMSSYLLKTHLALAVSAIALAMPVQNLMIE